MLRPTLGTLLVLSDGDYFDWFGRWSVPFVLLRVVGTSLVSSVAQYDSLVRCTDGGVFLFELLIVKQIDC